MIRKRAFALAILLVAFAYVAQAQSTQFALAAPDPVIEHGAPGSWDGRYTDPGAVLYHDGQFHMFRNGFIAWPGNVDIGYETSSDGINWSPMNDHPVLLSENVSYAGVAALASSAVVMPDGTWALYFYTWETYQSRASGAIGRATADNPLGPWMPDPEPALIPGNEGEWDDLWVGSPRVVQDGDVFRMYFDGGNADLSVWGIGMATSPDGVHWTKYDDPATTSPLYAQSDPVLVSEDGENRFHQPAILPAHGAGWVMIYRTFPVERRPGRMTLGYATSEDGIHWTVSDQNPIWTIADLNNRSFWWHSAAYDGETYYLYIESGSAGTDIYAAAHHGPFD